MTRRFIDDYLLYLLARASHQASAQFHAEVKRVGLKVPEWRVLAALFEGDGLSVGDLARITLYQQPTLTKVLDRMARQDWIRRQSDAQDKRLVRIHIRPAGRKLARGLLVRAKAHEAVMLDGYGAAAAVELKKRLRALIKRTN